MLSPRVVSKVRRKKSSKKFLKSKVNLVTVSILAFVAYILLHSQLCSGSKWCKERE